MKFTIRDFYDKFPNDDACLHHLFTKKYGDMETCPKCSKKAKFYRIRTRKSYGCQCGYQVYPMKGTIMEGSTTPIGLWYFAIYLFSQSKNGVSAKELERQLGVTYKTAWRIGHKIRDIMVYDEGELCGVVEVDESLYGGKAKGKRGWGAENKVILFGMIEREGKIRIVHVPNRQYKTLMPIMQKSIKEGTVVHTDKFKVYRALPDKGYDHKVKNNDDIDTNAIEGYWGNFKKSVLGTHTWVTQKYLQNYLDEFSFRHNHRKAPHIFPEMMERL